MRMMAPATPRLQSVVLVAAIGALPAFLAWNVVPRPLLIYGVVMLAVGSLPIVMALRRPKTGLYILIVLIPIEELTTVLSGGESTMLRFYGVAVAFAWFAGKTIRRDGILFPPLVGLLLAWLAWDVASIAWAKAPGHTAARAVSEAQLMIFYVMCVDLLRARRDALNAMALFVGAGGVAALWALRGLASEERLRLSLISDEGSGANQLGHLLSMVAIIALFLAPAMPVKVRLMLRAVVALSILGMFTALARGNLIAFAAAVLAVAMIERETRVRITHRLRAISLAAVLLVSGYVALTAGHLLPEISIDRLSWDRLVGVDAGGGRIDFVKVGITMASEQPLLGVGLDNYPTRFSEYEARTPGLASNYPEGRDPHNDYVRRFAETGLVGFTISIVFIGATFVALARAPVSGRLSRALWASSTGCLIVTLLGSSFNSYMWRKRYWLAFAFVAVVERTAQQRTTSASFEGPQHQHVPNIG